jgi:hypothetical protein
MGWVVNQAPAALALEKRPGTHWTGGWVVPRVGLDGCGKSRPSRIRSSEIYSTLQPGVHVQLGKKARGTQ